MSTPKTKPQSDVIPPELEEGNPIADEVAAFDEDPYGFDEPDDFGLNNSWDWGGGD